MRIAAMAAGAVGGYFGARGTDEGAFSGFVAATLGRGGFSATAQGSRGFRDPTSSDRYYRGPTGRGFITGNPDLDPERSLTAQLAFDLARVRDLKEAFELQQSFAKKQMEAYATQAQELTRLMAAAADDPRALLVWAPLAQTSRALFPAEFTALDVAAGRTFPFSVEQIEAAHAKWTAGWLSWELSHDAEYKLKVQTLADLLGPEAGSALGRARLAAVEREKIARYQERYEEYTRVAKALQRLEPGP